jgi:Spy/CpxP family protein refolding chaperone
MKNNGMYYGMMVALLLLAGPAVAQMGNEDTGPSGMKGSGMMGGGGGMMGMHGKGMDMGGMDEMTHMMRTTSKLNLTAEQQKKLQLSTLQHQKDAIPLLGQVRMAGVEIQELLLADSVNLDKVKAKVKEKYDAAAKLEMSHLALTQEIKKMLTPEQRQRMESMMMQMGPMMGSMPMMDSMMGSSSGPAKAEPAPSEASGGPKDGPESKDPHGH